MTVAVNRVRVRAVSHWRELFARTFT